jgi:hypothetical protein
MNILMRYSLSRLSFTASGFLRIAPLLMWLMTWKLRLYSVISWVLLLQPRYANALFLDIYTSSLS